MRRPKRRSGLESSKHLCEAQQKEEARPREEVKNNSPLSDFRMVQVLLLEKSSGAVGLVDMTMIWR